MNEQVLTNPVLIDKALLEVNAKLKETFSWLQNTYGQCDTWNGSTNGVKIVAPIIHISESEHLKLFPSDELGNFAFWKVKDSQTLDSFIGGSTGKYKGEVSFILHFNFKTVFGENWQQYSTENAKKMIVDFFASSFFQYISLRLKLYWKDPQNIYKEFTKIETQDQYFLRPYGGFRIDFDFSLKSTTC